MTKKFFALTSIALATLTGSIAAQAESYNPVLSRALIVSTNSNGATINFNVLMEQFRSIPSSTSGSSTVNKKIARFVVNDSRSGSGFHSRDSLLSQTSLASPRSRNSGGRDAGGYHTLTGAVSEYNVSIAPSRGAANLFQHTPRNVNARRTVDERFETSFGTNASLGAEVSQDGPKISGSIGSNTSRTRLNRLVFELDEYRTRNSSSGNTFRLGFINTILDGCGGEALRVASGGSCTVQKRPDVDSRAGVNAEGVRVFDASKLSPISYANFTPSFGASFDVDPSESGTTNFNIAFSMQIGSLDGEGIGGASAFGAVGDITYKANGFRHERTVSASTNIEVDWSHPIFNANTTVRLQSLTDRNTCLVARIGGTGSGYVVAGETCNNTKKGQVWSLNNQDEYRTALKNNLCLDLHRNDSNVIVATCNGSNSQRWKWVDDQLTNQLFVNGGRPAIAQANSRGNYIRALNPDPNHPSNSSVIGFRNEFAPRIINVQSVR